MRDKSDVIMSLLGVGQDNARSAAELARVLDTDKRTVRAMVEIARAAGIPICSGNAGYWMPESLEDLRATERRLRAQAIGIFKSLKPIRKMLREEGGGNA